MKKLMNLCTLLVVAFAIMFTLTPVSAKESVIGFEDPINGSYFETEYNETEYTLKQVNEDDFIWYVVHDDTDTELEAWGFNLAENKGRSTNAAWNHTHRITLPYGQEAVINTVSLSASRSGSFRWFNHLNWHGRSMAGGSYFSIDTSHGSATPAGNQWPASSVYVNHSTTVARTLTQTESVTIGASLISHGYSHSTPYYFYYTAKASYTIHA